MMTASATEVRKAAVRKNQRLQQGGSIQWVPLNQVRINPMAQRELVQARVNKLLADFDPEHFGQPVANHRDGFYYIVDGQHRVEALKLWLGDGWETQQFQAWVFEGLTEEQEAEVFLRRNDVQGVNAFNKFRIAVEAGRHAELQVKHIVESKGLVVSLDRNADNAVGAVGKLLKVYRRDGADILASTLEIIRDAYGKAGLEATVIDGMAMLLSRYEDVDKTEAHKYLAKAYGGVGGVLNRAETERKATGLSKAECVASVLVGAYNAGAPKGAHRLRGWWKQ